MASPANFRLKCLDGLRQDREQINSLSLHQQVANVEQTRGKLCDLPHLPFDQFVHSTLHSHLCTALAAQHAKAALNRCQWTTQLMREDGQELVLAPIGCTQLLDFRSKQMQLTDQESIFIDGEDSIAFLGSMTTVAVQTGVLHRTLG